MSLGSAVRLAHVQPVSVHALNSAVVALSTFQATVALAFTNVELVVLHSDQEPHKLYVILPSVVNHAISQSVLGLAHNAESLAVLSA